MFGADAFKATRGSNMAFGTEPRRNGERLVRHCAMAVVLAAQLVLSACGEHSKRYQTFTNERGIQTWIDTKTGASISCPLQAEDDRCWVYGAFEERARAIRENMVREAAQRVEEERERAAEAASLTIGPSEPVQVQSGVGLFDRQSAQPKKDGEAQR